MGLPIRSCIACRKRENQIDLLRVVKSEGKVLPDSAKRMPGRGAWLHPQCLEMAINRRAFERALKSEEILDPTPLIEYLGTL